MPQDTIRKWNLNDIEPSNSFPQLCSEVESEIKLVDTWVSQLDPEMGTDEFKKLMEFREKLIGLISRLNYLPGLMEATDQKNPQAHLFKSQADNLTLEYSQKTRIISHWLKGKKIKGIKRLDDSNAQRLFQSIPDLSYSLNYERLAARHTLSRKEELIISQKDVNGSQVLTDLRSLIETEFDYELKVQSKKPKVKSKKIKTQAELLALVHHPKAEIREAAYLTLLNKQRENLDKFFLVYQAIVKDWDFEARLRGFTSPIQVRNFANHLGDKAVDNLLAACRKNRDIFQTFFRYKARVLGQKRLKRFDIYAPADQKEDRISFSQAWEEVRSVFAGFSPRFAQAAEKVFSQNHVDSHPKSNKRGGAFCATVNPEITPYVMMNFTGQVRDEFTLAHELGHAVHSLLANKHYPSVQHANLPLAETASTLAEMILFENRYARETNREARKSMLVEKLADSYASILRQNYFVLFEIKAHEQISKGTTAEKLSDLWLETLKEQFEDSVEIDPVFRYEWSYIPHIVNTPFYCYAYNFGELLSYALFARYKKEGPDFVLKIESLLASGGSEDPSVILKKIGIDIDSPDTWTESFFIIRDWQSRLEQL